MSAMTSKYQAESEAALLHSQLESMIKPLCPRLVEWMKERGYAPVVGWVDTNSARRDPIPTAQVFRYIDLKEGK